MRTEISHEVAKSSPAVAVSGWVWAHDLTINETLGLVTIGYVCLQAAYLAWKWYREYKAKK